LPQVVMGFPSVAVCQAVCLCAAGGCARLPEGLD
jgi:hypothetical protein